MTRCEQEIRSLLSALAICVVLALLMATGCEPPAKPPLSVLLVSLDTTRRDRLSAYGYARDTSPSLERLAREGTRFDSAYSPTASTGPTHATLFTGLYPIAHRVLKNGAILTAEHETLAERLARQKYQTAAVVGSFVLDARFGFAQGFDLYDDDFVAHEASIPEPGPWQGIQVNGAFDRRADHTSRRAIRWLREQRDPNRPFFLFVHYFDPHMPYLPPSSYKWRYTPRAGAPDGVTWARDWDEMSAWYDGEIRFVDDQLADLLTTLDELGLAESTLVVVVGDHGEGLMEHGVLSHGLVLYEEAVAIPLLIRTPGTAGTGQVIGEPVELTDVLPTVLDLSRNRRSAGVFQGRNLAPRMRGESSLDPLQPIHLYRVLLEPGFAGIDNRIRVDGDMHALRVGRWKYIVGDKVGTRMLYDLETDPEERQNQIEARPEVAAELAEDLQRWLRTNGRKTPMQGDGSGESRDGLRALGYVE